jgi:hypothetical protein
VRVYVCIIAAGYFCPRSAVALCTQSTAHLEVELAAHSSSPPRCANVNGTSMM